MLYTHNALIPWIYIYNINSNAVRACKHVPKRIGSRDCVLWQRRKLVLRTFPRRARKAADKVKALGRVKCSCVMRTWPKDSMKLVEFGSVKRALHSDFCKKTCCSDPFCRKSPLISLQCCEGRFQNGRAQGRAKVGVCLNILSNLNKCSVQNNRPPLQCSCPAFPSLWTNSETVKGLLDIHT